MLCTCSKRKILQNFETESKCFKKPKFLYLVKDDLTAIYIRFRKNERNIIVNEFKYLGIFLSRSGFFNKNIMYLVEQANKTFLGLFKKIRNLNLSIDLQIELFNRTLKPVLLHGSEIWVQLLVFFCSSVPVVLFDTPGISRCRSQHVSVESSSLLHHSIYL